MNKNGLVTPWIFIIGSFFPLEKKQTETRYITVNAPLLTVKSVTNVDYDDDYWFFMYYYNFLHYQLLFSTDWKLTVMKCGNYYYCNNTQKKEKVNEKANAANK
jgi:hypothetical protein